MKKLLLCLSMLCLGSDIASAVMLINHTKLPISFTASFSGPKGSPGSHQRELGPNSTLSFPLFAALKALREAIPVDENGKSIGKNWVGELHFHAAQDYPIEGQALKTPAKCANDLLITPDMSDARLQQMDNKLTITLDPDPANPNAVGQCRFD
jgi:hypothetical protein